MHSCNIDGNLHIRRLLGVVLETTRNAILGQLLQYIDCKGTMDYELWSGKVTFEMKTKWAAQVKEAVSGLHQAGTVWVDAKTDNILIDMDDNAWLIDFGGGYTEGWVDADKAGTVEGDLQGLENIVKAIFEERQIDDDEDDLSHDSSSDSR